MGQNVTGEDVQDELTCRNAARSITRSYFRGSAGALLVFDVTERSSG